MYRIFIYLYIGSEQNTCPSSRSAVITEACDRTILLDGLGCIVASGSPSAIRAIPTCAVAPPPTAVYSHVRDVLDNFSVPEASAA